MIEPYIGMVRRALPRVPGRAGMLREVRDGLDDAVRAHRERGSSLRDAEEQAVREFGPPELVAAGLRTELAAAVARQMALLLVVFGVVTWILTQQTWQAAAARQGSPEPTAAYDVGAHLVDVFSVLATIMLVTSAYLLGRGGRILSTRRVVRVLAAGVLVFLGIWNVASVMLTVFTPVDGLHRLELAQVAIGVLWLSATVGGAWLALQCLRLTSRSGSRPEDRADDAADLLPVLLPRG
ncbi:hypothetical protein EF847_04065 [Actinobacteria bacterium YIM 96077]|uniref:permease prefix domain 1-containing protein n=1 Tax=Phytoactinopolyspora halophila TaxID=1981511 RepID=UPI000F502C70|nr:permease prefix domain 1-containing protein [Phytoactinopolyspora halophila]AYY12006.1 hypothetical protein EF847_04065 [Actinobacteria bacterium YIM 96077]